MVVKKASVTKRATCKKAARRPATGKRVERITPLLRAKIPPEIIAQLENACATGKWLIAIWRVEDRRIYLNRTATDFPTTDIDLPTTSSS
jgi:hypothetical protein